MNKEELHIKAIDNANSRIKTIDRRCLAAIADYDLGLIQGFEDGAEWMRDKMIEKAAEWLRLNLHNYAANVSYQNLLDSFKKAMED